MSQIVSQTAGAAAHHVLDQRVDGGVQVMRYGARHELGQQVHIGRDGYTAEVLESRGDVEDAIAYRLKNRGVDVLDEGGQVVDGDQVLVQRHLLGQQYTAQLNECEKTRRTHGLKQALRDTKDLRELSYHHQLREDAGELGMMAEG
ncbi:ORFL119C [Human betaherpesvirus 5]|nr:ORFL119C [Human betaherpesvirus 5]QHX40440.1 ORFL119C [Human betaherpesvirus 5]